MHVCIPAAVLSFSLAACAGGDDPSTDNGGSIVSAEAPVPGATNDIPLPIGTSDLPLPASVVSADLANAFAFVVNVGVDSSPDRVESVPIGSSVTMSITNPDSDDEFLLHGYEMGAGVFVPAGQAEAFTFMADQPGQFQLESATTGDILMILSVG
jgi:hypothetical protein